MKRSLQGRQRRRSGGRGLAALLAAAALCLAVAAVTLERPADEDVPWQRVDAAVSLALEGMAAAQEAAAAASEPEGPVDLNAASAAELQALQGIGPAKAQAIVDDRETNGPFAQAEDLLRVTGIGEKTLENLKADIVVYPVDVRE
ncbi:ComEA family DNA-binding protein [Paenibacillus sabuli]|nr:ComEA family DNA-binding protein [Paenibacillus sabuli]